MEFELRTYLVELATRYAAARKLELVTVARLATGDWRFFERLEAGASFTARKYDVIVEWFSRNWPSDAAWPPGPPRSAEVDATPSAANDPTQGEAA